MTNNKAKILILDIETAPETAWIWKRFKETVGQTQIKEAGYLLCIAWKWLDEKNTKIVSIFNNRSWNRGNRSDDSAISKTAHGLISQADIIVGHNVKPFDLATLNARFLYHNLPPPTPYKVCDTLDILKKKFRLPSNSLESASHYFNIDTKEKQHFSLWRDCLNGDPVAWKKMTTYCAHDVNVVEQLYKKLIPWSDTHPNVALFSDTSDNPVCPKCGSDNLEKRGFQPTMVSFYQRYRCNNCGGWSRDRKSVKTDRSHIQTHAVN